MELETQAAFDPASFEHIPVLLNECLTGLAIDPAGTYLDGTAGGAGHSRQIALRLDPAKGRLIALDQDPDAVQTARAFSKWVIIRPVKVAESISISSHGIRRFTSSNTPSLA